MFFRGIKSIPLNNGVKLKICALRNLGYSPAETHLLSGIKSLADMKKHKMEDQSLYYFFYNEIFCLRPLISQLLFMNFHNEP